MSAAAATESVNLCVGFRTPDMSVSLNLFSQRNGRGWQLNVTNESYAELFVNADSIDHEDRLNFVGPTPSFTLTCRSASKPPVVVTVTQENVTLTATDGATAVLKWR